MKKITISFGDYAEKRISESFTICEAVSSIDGSTCYLLFPEISDTICSPMYFPSLSAAMQYVISEVKF